MNSEKGASLIDTAFLVACVAMVALLAVSDYGGSLAEQYGEIAVDIGSDDPTAVTLSNKWRARQNGQNNNGHGHGQGLGNGNGNNPN